MRALMVIDYNQLYRSCGSSYMYAEQFVSVVIIMHGARYSEHIINKHTLH